MLEARKKNRLRALAERAPVEDFDFRPSLNMSQMTVRGPDHRNLSEFLADIQAWDEARQRAVCQRVDEARNKEISHPFRPNINDTSQRMLEVPFC